MRKAIISYTCILASSLFISCGNSSNEENINAERREIEKEQSEEYSGGHGSEGTTAQEDSTANQQAGQVTNDPHGVNASNTTVEQKTTNQAIDNEKSDNTAKGNADKKNTLTPKPPKP